MTYLALQRIKNEVNECYFEKVSQIYFEFLAKKLPATEMQIALQECTTGSHVRLAISLLVVDQGLGGVRAYLTIHDELQSKGYSEVSLDFLYKVQQIYSWHPLVFGRLINRLYLAKFLRALKLRLSVLLIH